MDEKHEEAIEYLNSYIDTNPYCEVAWHQLGRQYIVVEDYEKALKSFEYAVLIDESFIGGYLEKAKTLEILERHDEAIENYLVTLELDDPTAFVYLRIGSCYIVLKETKKAIEYYKKAINEDPLLDKGWMALTNIYFELEDYAKSLYYIKKVVSIDEFNPLYWRKYGEINLKLSFFEETISAFRRCLSLDDKSLEIWIALVDVLYYIGDYNEALKVLVQAKNYYKETAEIEYRFFGLFMETGKTETALLHLKNGLALDFEFCSVIKELYPRFFKLENVKEILSIYSSNSENL
jgi:tetratricopeptide (TPR) repeat protein